MAEAKDSREKVPNTSKKRAVRFVVAPHIPPRTYVNTWQISIQEHEVFIKLGDTLEQTPDAQIVRESVGLALSHSAFVEFAEAAARIKTALEIAHGGEIPKASVLTPEVLAAMARAIEPEKG